MLLLGKWCCVCCIWWTFRGSKASWRHSYPRPQAGYWTNPTRALHIPSQLSFILSSDNSCINTVADQIGLRLLILRLQLFSFQSFFSKLLQPRCQIFGLDLYRHLFIISHYFQVQLLPNCCTIYENMSIIRCLYPLASNFTYAINQVRLKRSAWHWA